MGARLSTKLRRTGFQPRYGRARTAVEAMVRPMKATVRIVRSRRVLAEAVTEISRRSVRKTT